LQSQPTIKPPKSILLVPAESRDGGDATVTISSRSVTIERRTTTD
jgi:hypothetical protein